MMSSCPARRAGTIAPSMAIAVNSTICLDLARGRVFVPPFTGASPWILGGLDAVLAPFGPVIGSLLLGDPTRPAHALRRLDSRLVAGPAWAAASLMLLNSS